MSITSPGSRVMGLWGNRTGGLALRRIQVPLRLARSCASTRHPSSTIARWFPETCRYGKASNFGASCKESASALGCRPMMMGPSNAMGSIRGTFNQPSWGRPALQGSPSTGSSHTKQRARSGGFACPAVQNRDSTSATSGRRGRLAGIASERVSPSSSSSAVRGAGPCLGAGAASSSGSLPLGFSRASGGSDPGMESSPDSSKERLALGKSPNPTPSASTTPSTSGLEDALTCPRCNAVTSTTTRSAQVATPSPRSGSLPLGLATLRVRAPRTARCHLSPSAIATANEGSSSKPAPVPSDRVLRNIPSSEFSRSLENNSSASAAPRWGRATRTPLARRQRSTAPRSTAARP